MRSVTSSMRRVTSSVRRDVDGIANTVRRASGLASSLWFLDLLKKEEERTLFGTYSNW